MSWDMSWMQFKSCQNLENQIKLFSHFVPIFKTAALLRYKGSQMYTLGQWFSTFMSNGTLS